MALSLDLLKPVGAAVVLASFITSLATDYILVKATIPAVVGGVMAAMSENDQKFRPQNLLRSPSREFAIISASTGVVAHMLSPYLPTSNRPEIVHLVGFAISTALFTAAMAAKEFAQKGPLLRKP